jgi:prepilin-type N-terminal cleavage/methylation domain-containing protein
MLASPRPTPPDAVPAGRRARLRRTRGFTLIELMIVVVLVSILSALAVPALSRSRNDQLAFNYARQTQLLFNRTRTRATIGYAQLLTADFSDRGILRQFEAIDDDGCARSGLWDEVKEWNGSSALTRVRTVDALNFNAATNAINTTEDLRARENSGAKGVAYCVMPSGRVFVGTGGTVKAAIEAMQKQAAWTWNGALDVRVTTGSGATRSVLVGGGSSARVLSR